MAADWLSSIAPHEVRTVYDGDRAGDIDATCPLTGGHAETNTCFHVRNAKLNDEFMIFCLHTDCKLLAAKANGKQDRGKYLDALCVKHGVECATELLPFCSEAAQVSWAPDPLAAFEEIKQPPPGAASAGAATARA